MRDQNLRALVRGAYDIQQLRIQTGGRIVANFRSKLGIMPGQKEEELSNADAQRILKNLKEQYIRITDGMAQFPRQINFNGNGLISTMTELALIAQYFDLEKREKQHFRNLERVLKEQPVYTLYLQGIKGIGPAMAGVIISEIDISRARYPSSLWKYAGLDVASDGRGRSRKAEHLVEVEYTDKNGETKTKKGISFNPILKTKLIGVVGSSFLRAGGDYAKIYYDYKNRLECHPQHKDKTKVHRHNMAIRYMVKMFLLDLYLAWRKIEGLPVNKSYHEAKLGHKHAVAV